MRRAFQHLPPAVAEPLRQYARHRRFVGWRRLALSGAALYGALLLAATHVDRFAFLDPGPRIGLLVGVHLLALLVVGARAVRFQLHRPSEQDTAYGFEHDLGRDVAERFVTLDSLLAATPDPAAADSAVHEELLAHLRQDTEACSAGVHGERLAQDRRLPATVAAALLPVLAGALLCLVPDYQFGLMLARFYAPWRNLPKPSFTRIRVTPEQPVVGRGGELVLQAEITATAPPPLAWILDRLGMDTRRCLLERADAAAPVPMTRIQKRLFLFTQPGLEQDLLFRVRCGDARTALGRVDVVAQPRVDRIRLDTTPPAYTGLPPACIENPTGPVALLRGTRVVVQYGTDQPVSGRRILAAGQEPFPDATWDPATRTGCFELLLDQPLKLDIEVVNERGFRNVEPATLSLEPVEDQAPAVRLSAPAADSEKVPGELVPVEGVLEDDLGLVEAALRWQVNPATNPEAPFQETPVPALERGARTVRVSFALDLARTGAVPGDEIVAVLRVRDSAGNDGQSSPFTLRVVAFTRGENERLRLRTLRFAAFALPRLDAPPEERGTATAETRAEARRLGIPFPETADHAALLALLEREVHYTDAPRHKDDLAALHGLLAAGQRVPPERVLALTASRQLQNILWRLYGMRDEAERIRASLADTPPADGAADAPAGMRADALLRRTQLYLTTLQDIGDELLELARRHPAFDAPALTERQGALNSTAYFLTRGSNRRRQEACVELGGGLRELIAVLRPSLAPLRRDAQTARSELEAALRATESRLVAAGDPATRAWFLGRCRLLDLNPFTPAGEHLAALAGAAGLSWTPPPEAAAAERQWCAWLAGAWERDALQTLPGISAEERALALDLLATEVPAAPPGASFDSCTEAVLRTAPALPDPADPVAAVDRFLARVTAPSTPAPDLVPALEQLLAAFAFRLRFVEPLGPRAAEQDLLLLRLRQALGRYRLALQAEGTAPPATDAAPPPPGAGDEAAGAPAPPPEAAPAAQVSLGGLVASLEQAAAEYRAGAYASAEIRQGYPFLEVIAGCRALVQAAAAPAPELEPFLAATPEARLILVRDRLPRLGELLARLAAAETALGVTPADAAAFAQALAQAAAAATAFETAAGRDAELGPPATELLNRLERLRQGAGWDAEAVRRRLFSLGELRTQAEAMQGRATALLARGVADPGGFEGGPPGIWDEEQRRHALHARRRVVAQFQAARGAAILGILAHGQDDGGPAQAQAGAAWAHLTLRLVLSDLAGPVRARPRARPQDGGGDRFLQWLRRELDAARQGLRADPGDPAYRGTMREYLDAAADYLRY